MAATILHFKPIQDKNWLEREEAKKAKAKLKREIKKELVAKMEEARTKARKELALELRGTRSRLELLRKTLLGLQSEVSFLSNMNTSVAFCHKFNASVKDNLYPEVPPPMVLPHIEGIGIPGDSGIYFLWQNGVVAYVGKSIKLSSRLKLGAHHSLQATDIISFVLIEKHFLTWAENYYIGTLQPSRNYGIGGDHNRYPVKESKSC